MCVETSEDVEVLPTFDARGLKDDMNRGVYAYGFERPSAVQQRAVLPILKGRNVIVQAQSGTGKTCVFCYGALQTVDPSLQTAPQVLLLSPTEELAEQTQKVCLALGAPHPSTTVNQWLRYPGLGTYPGDEQS